MENLSASRKKRDTKDMLFLSIGIFIGFLVTSLLFFVFTQFNTEKPETRNWDKHLESAFTPLSVSLDEDLQKDIYLLAHSYDLEFTFVMGLIQQESGFDATVVSDTKDWGLMQINEINHDWLKKELSIKNFLNPYQNIQAGMYMLSDLFEKYKKPQRVLMAYNLGETGAKRLWKQKIYATNYSKKILNNQKKFQKYLAQEKKKDK